MAKFGALKIWHKFLNTMAKFGTKFPDHGIRTSIHPKFSQTLCTLGIESRRSASAMQYFNNSTTTRVCCCHVKQGSYLEHDVVLNNMWCCHLQFFSPWNRVTTTTPQHTASVLKHQGEIWCNFVVPNSAVPNYARSKFCTFRYVARLVLIVSHPWTIRTKTVVFCWGGGAKSLCFGGLQ